MPLPATLRTRAAIGLARGASGQVIEDLQAYLRQFGYLRITPEQVPYVRISKASAPEARTGIFDEATARALASFQRFSGLPVTGVLDEATLAKLNSPRCGFPDLPNIAGVSRYEVHGNRWATTKLTYGFDNFCADIPEAQVRSAIAEAFRLWSLVTPLTFSEVSSNPDIRICFVAGDHGDGFPFDGAGAVVAHAYSPPPNGGNIAGDAHFDEDEAWAVAIPVPEGTFDLVSVAAHEFGHSLGLMHSSIQGALMFPFYNGVHRFLDQDDIRGIQSIYGALAAGRGEFYTTEGGALQSLGVHTNWSTTWDLIIPGNFGGNSYTDLIFYDREGGEGEFYTTDGHGGLSLLKKHSDWGRSWDLIIPGNFGGSGHTDLLFYDRERGEGEFYTTDGHGSLSLLKRHSGWWRAWDLIIPGNFGGSSYTDLLFYDRSSGEAAFYTTDGSGGIRLLGGKKGGWRRNWDLIVPGDFGGSAYTDLLCYDRGAGQGAFYKTDGSGGISLLRQHTGWRRSWEFIIPGNFGGSSRTDLLFYDRGAGEGVFYTTDGSGGISLLRQNGGWRTTWSCIVPGGFGGSSRTDLLFYER